MTDEEMIDELEGVRLTQWEEEFLMSLRDRLEIEGKPLTQRQQEVLFRIYEERI